MKEPFERVVTAHGATVLRVCRAVLGVHDADDAWSETFLSALKAYPGLPADANVEAWLVTIAHRRAIDLIRDRQRQPLAVEDVPERSSVGGPSGDDRVELWRAVGSLPDKQRTVVAYHYLGGLPFSDIADLIGGSVEAARRASSDGVRSLRAIYAKEHSGEHPLPRSEGEVR